MSLDTIQLVIINYCVDGLQFTKDSHDINHLIWWGVILSC
jgi:hypothetical protein